MKFLAACIALAALSSCNTTIGVGRDIAEGFRWGNRKIQEKRAASQQAPADQGGYEDYSGAPVY